MGTLVSNWYFHYGDSYQLAFRLKESNPQTSVLYMYFRRSESIFAYPLIKGSETKVT